MAALLEAGRLRLDRVIIHAIEDSTFRAVLRLQPLDDEPDDDDVSEGELESDHQLEIDARPSDAIAWPSAPAAASGCWKKWSPRPRSPWMPRQMRKTGTNSVASWIS